MLRKYQRHQLGRNPYHSKMHASTVQIYVDMSDILFTLLDINGVDADAAYKMHADLVKGADAFGRITKQVVYYDQSMWPWFVDGENSDNGHHQKWVDSGFTMVSTDLSMGTYGMDLEEGSSEIDPLLYIGLDIYDSVLTTRPGTVFFVTGESNYLPLLKRIRSLGVFVVLASLDGMDLTMRSEADLWVSLSQDLQLDKDRGEEGDDFEYYDFDDFIKFVDDLENSNLSFVGLRYLISLMPNELGIQDSAQRHKLVERAQEEGILEIYKKENINNKENPVTACKLNRMNDTVLDVLSEEDEEGEGEAELKHKEVAEEDVDAEVDPLVLIDEQQSSDSITTLGIADSTVSDTTVIADAD